MIIYIGINIVHPDIVAVINIISIISNIIISNIICIRLVII